MDLPRDLTEITYTSEILTITSQGKQTLLTSVSSFLNIVVDLPKENERVTWQVICTLCLSQHYL